MNSFRGIPELTFDDILLLPGLSSFKVAEEKSKINIKTRITKNLQLDVPIVSSPMPGVTEAEMAIAIAKKGGLGFIHPFQSDEHQYEEVSKVKKQKLKVAACITDISSLKHVENLLKLGTDLISLETLNAHNTLTINFVKSLKKKFPKIEISAALVVTGDATEALIKAGADNIRVGIGGGSHCTTRLVTGVGRPQLSAIEACYHITKKFNIPLISDTGIKYPGDIVKAIAFGADVVMIGGLLAGTDECPGPIITRHGRKYKYTWGMCTDTAVLHKQPSLFNSGKFIDHFKHFLTNIFGNKPENNKNPVFEEGVEGFVPYKGSAEVVLRELISGIYRSLWYQGFTTLQQAKDHARIVVVSANTQLENVPRI